MASFPARRHASIAITVLTAAAVVLSGCSDNRERFNRNPFLRDLAGYDLVYESYSDGSRWAGQADTLVRIYFAPGDVDSVTGHLKDRLANVVEKTPEAVIEASSEAGALAVIDGHNTSFSVTDGAPPNYPQQQPPPGEIAVAVQVSERY